MKSIANLYINFDKIATYLKNITKRWHIYASCFVLCKLTFDLNFIYLSFFKQIFYFPYSIKSRSSNEKSLFYKQNNAAFLPAMCLGSPRLTYITTFFS